MINVYNKTTDTYDGPNDYYIGRGSILGNPYTHIKDGSTKAKYVVSTRENAIELYNNYYDIMYSGNIEYKNIIDEIYDKYKNGEDVYLGCYCYPKTCHGDVIVAKLRSRLMKEKINAIMRDKKERKSYENIK